MLWLKAFHLISVICWFAGLFYLPRLFVYHAMSDDETSRARFKVMERKLYRGIMTPSMVLSVLFGGWLLAGNWGYYQTQLWLHIKLALVAVLIVYHFLCGHYLRQLRDDQCAKSHVYFRWFNEFPVLLLIAVVILAVVRPF